MVTSYRERKKESVMELLGQNGAAFPLVAEPQEEKPTVRRDR